MPDKQLHGKVLYINGAEAMKGLCAKFSRGTLSDNFSNFKNTPNAERQKSAKNERQRHDAQP